MTGKGRRYYPPTEEQQQTGPFGNQLDPNNQSNFSTNFPASTPILQPQLASPLQPTHTQGPSNLPSTPNPTPDQHVTQYQYPQQPHLEPTFGHSSAPPIAYSQMETSYDRQSAQTQIVATKSKHVFALDPESTYPTDQITSSMGQMGLSQQAQPFTATSTQPSYPTTPTTITPSPQYIEEVNFNENAQAPPIYVRMTINAVPDTSSLFNKCNIPLGAVVHPLAETAIQKDKIPTVNFGVSGIIRCRKCRAYINPFVVFTDGGRRWKCNLCGLSNDVPGEYFSPLDRNGKRTDLDQRPELSKGCVEFIAPTEYMVRPPMPPTYFFVIDVGYYSIISGMLHTTVQAIKSILNEFPGDTRTRIGFITYDTTVHFYNLRSSLSNPQMLVVSDIEDVFIPLPDDLLVNLSDSKQVIETLLNKLPSIHQSTQIVDSALGVALKASFNIIKNIGGKILVFANTLPTVGAGKLPNREDLKLLGTDKESTLLVPDVNDYYKEFALDCSRQQISIDTFLFSNQSFMDVATLGSMSQFTGGQVYYYPTFRADKDGEKFFRDLVRNITRETGWEAVMRVRTSRGLKVSAHYGNFFIRSTDLLALPSIDADKAFTVQFAHSDNNVGTRYASFQCALLYTTSGGERRIRVATQCWPVVSQLSELFRLADVESVTAILTKMAIEKALNSRLSDAREALINKIIDILTIYRTDLVSTGTGSTQLMLPDTLKLLPLYILALIKHVTLRMGTEIRPDERSAAIMIGRILPIPLLLNYIYPRMFAIHNMPPESGAIGENGHIILPPTVNLSSEKLDRKGIFLLDDTQSLYMWIGKEVPLADPGLLPALFGVSTLDNIDTSQLNTLPRLENEYNSRVQAIIQEIRTQRPTHANLYVVREGEAREIKFFAYLVEDKTKSVHSYYEFLVNLHSRIQSKITKR